MIRGLERVGISEADERAMLRASNQCDLCVQNDGTSAFAANQRARDMEAALRQEILEVVAGDTPRNLGKPRADARRMRRAQGPKPGINLGPPAALSHDRFEFRAARCTNGQLGAVVQQYSQFFDVVDGLPREQRMGTAGVVADHAAKRAPAV